MSSAQTETAEKPDLNYMNNVQIIPSNYTPNDQSAKIEINTSNCQQIKEHPIQTTSNKSILPTSIESHDDIQNARQFGAITNISIGANEKQTVQQQEQLHYEQVFITHTPSGASISTGNSTGNTDPNEIQPKINRIKVDSAHRLATDDSAEIRPSTSTSSAITFSVASTASMAVATTTDANISNSVSKSKDPAKNNHENDLLSSRRPVLSRGVTEAVIMRPSRKDVNMLLNRINPQGNHVSYHCPMFVSVFILMQHFFFNHISVRLLNFTQIHSIVIRLNKEKEAHPHPIRKEIEHAQIIIMSLPTVMPSSITIA